MNDDITAWIVANQPHIENKMERIKAIADVQHKQAMGLFDEAIAIYDKYLLGTNSAGPS